MPSRSLKKSAIATHKFPARLHIRCIGKNTDSLREQVLAIVRRHATAVPEKAVSQKLSNGGKYLSVTVTVTVDNQSQYEALFRDLRKNPDIVSVL
jgi:putative lipoic acid-binding regulatory protein